MNAPALVSAVKKLLCLGAACALVAAGGARGAEQVIAPLHDIPVVCKADVVVVGGSSAAVAAAYAAADGKLRVALLAPRPYLGDDLCGRQLLWLEEGERPEGELARALFPDGRATTPWTVKTALDRALLARGVRYLTGCCATDLLVNTQGRPSGAVAVGRGGSLAVAAKVVIDATGHAVLARQAGARFRPFAPGEGEFRFIVVGGELQSASGISGRELDVAYKNPGHVKNGAPHPVFEYVARLPLRDGSFASLMRAEQSLRNLVCGRGMQDCSEYAFRFPDDTLMGDRRLDGEWPGPAQCDVGVFRPRGLARMYVLSQYADVAAKAQPAMMRPLAWLAVGELVGTAAALEAKQVTRAAEVRLAEVPVSDATPATVGEPRNVAPPPVSTTVVKVGQRPLPVVGEYDVVVVGGGTAGAPAGIAAARSGARTLVIEYLDELGGVGTAGLIGSYWYGVRGGFTREIDDAIGGANRWATTKQAGWNVVQKSEWLRRELLKAGADVWFGAFGCGAVVERSKVTGVVVATPQGRGVVLARTVVDATGNADIADAAGAETQFGLAPDGTLSVQLAGYPHRNLGDNVNNTCFAMVDDTGALNVWHLMAWVRTQRLKDGPYDVGQLLDTRERRRIVADNMLTTPDIVNRRTFPDTICHHKSNFDAAAFPTSPMLLVKDMKGPAFEVDLPYRSLLPKGLEGILVTGLGAGAERDAMTLVRMQADLQNQGYAAGTAAAMAAAADGCTRAIDVKELQRRLVAKGALAARVLTDVDSHPMGREAVEKAVQQIGTLRRGIDQQRTVEDRAIFGLAVVMAHPQQSLPLLRAAHDAADGDAKRNYATVLGILGDRHGAATLAAAVRNAVTWDKGFGLTTHRESDNTFSALDRLIIALGATAAPEGLEPIVAKVRQLRPESELSHFIAASMALRNHRSPREAVEPLTRLLATPGFAGHALLDGINGKHGSVAARTVAAERPDTRLNAAFKELLAAGMLAHCGEPQGLGRRVLGNYARGIEGHFARYARQVLKSLPPAGNAEELRAIHQKTVPGRE